MTINDKITTDPSGAPYAKLRSWMPGLAARTKLTKEDLTTLALLYERAHPNGQDVDRITMQYLCDCTGLDASSAFESIRRLMRKEFCSFEMSGDSGDFLGNFTIDEDGIARELAGAADDATGGKAKEPNRE